MKSKFLIVFFLVFHCIIYGQTIDDSITNGSFEKPDLSVWYSWTTAKPIISTINPHSGTKCLVLISGGSPMFQTVRVRPNSRYKLSGYLKTASGAEEVHMQVEGVGEANIGVVSADTKWTIKEIEFNTGTDQKQVKVVLFHPKSSVDNSAWADKPPTIGQSRKYPYFISPTLQQEIDYPGSSTQWRFYYRIFATKFYVKGIGQNS